MSPMQKNWTWFISILLLIVGGGVYLSLSHRSELGENFRYSVDEYRTVDAELIHYTETDPIVPKLGKLAALTIAPDGALVVGAENQIAMYKSSGEGQQGPAQMIPIQGRPSCLAVDDDGTVFAGMQDHVEVFMTSGDRGVWACPGPKAYFTSISVDDDFVFVADAGSRCIWRTPKKGGDPLKIEGDRKFYIPSPYFDIDLSVDGSLWVVNPGYHAFENYRTDGQIISSWENASMTLEGFSGCCNPANFALMPDGSFLTAEKGLPRVKIHHVDGSLRCVVAAPDQFDEGTAALDIAVDDTGRIYVLVEDRIRVFEEKKK